MRLFAIAAGLAFAISAMPVLGPAWAQYSNPPGAPIGGGGSGGGKPGYPDLMVNSSGKCWIDDDKTNYRWGDCPHVAQAPQTPQAPEGGHRR